MTSSNLVCLGLDHRTSPVELRERSRCTLESLRAALSSAQQDPTMAPLRSIREIALLSTCNRLELYAAVDPHLTYAEAEEALRLCLATASTASVEDLASMPFSCHHGLGVLEHLASVAAGLDSLVLGEAQILGQVSEAYQTAIAQRSIGPMLDALFLTALRAGKRVRSETAIGANPASISSVAVAFAQQQVGPLQDKNVVVIGLGKMAQLTLKVLASRRCTRVAVVNRTPEKARPHLVDGWKVYGLDQLDEALRTADVVLSATGAESFIIDAARMECLQSVRNGRHLTLIDVALPRDVDPAVGELPDMQRFDLDMLNAELDQALAARQREAPRARAIVAEEVGAFAITLRELAMRPLLADLRRQAEIIRQDQVARTLGYLHDDVDDEVRLQFEHLSRSLVNRLLHVPSLRLREVAVNGKADAYVAAVRDLFDLREFQDHPQ